MKKVEIIKIETLNPKLNSKKEAFSKHQLKEIKGGFIVEDAVGI